MYERIATADAKKAKQAADILPTGARARAVADGSSGRSVSGVVADIAAGPRSMTARDGEAPSPTGSLEPIVAPVEGNVSQGDGLWAWIQQQWSRVTGSGGSGSTGAAPTTGGSGTTTGGAAPTTGGAAPTTGGSGATPAATPATTPAATPAPPPPLTLVPALSFAGTISGGFAAPAFGQMNPTYSMSGISYAAAASAITVTATVNGGFQWGINSGGRVDVPTATDAVVTSAAHPSSGKKVWETIRDDLKPSAASPHKSARTNYWSAALTERHEKFHAQDFKQWCETVGMADITTFLASKTVTAQSEVRAHLTAAISRLSRGAIEYYLGGSSDPGHSSRAGEITAYADGQPHYQALADAVEVQGRALDAAAAAAATPAPATTPAATPSPSGTPAPSGAPAPTSGGSGGSGTP